MKTRIGIFGYGNLGRGVESAVNKASDMELAAVFTRRDPSTVTIKTENVPVVHSDDILQWKDRIDVLILCGGSAFDLPEQTPMYAKDFNVVDSFDTHANIPQHFAAVDAAAAGNKTAVISAGWDPGLFSLIRVFANAVLPQGRDYTFWGRGVSQGHSDAVRRVKGVRNAKQYTVPVDEALAAVRGGEDPELTTRQKHTREVYVVAGEGADKEQIVHDIVTMPNYFDEYDTTVTFISEEEFAANHSGMAHGGFVFRSGKTGWEDENKHIIEFSLKLDSNPEFTGSVITAYARAVKRLYDMGVTGCKTVLDIPASLLSEEDPAELRKHLL